MQYLSVWLHNAGFNTHYNDKLFNPHTAENHHAPSPTEFTGSDFLVYRYAYEYLNSTWQRIPDPPVSHEGHYTINVLAHKAKDVLDDTVKADEPLILIIAPVAPHSNKEVHGASAIHQQDTFRFSHPMAA